MKRIEFIASLLKGYEVAIDIGSDHGFVLKEALDHGFIKRGIATDNKKGPLKAAQENLKGYDVEFILSDGFRSVESKADVAVIAGMGAHLICDILSHSPLQLEFILGPNDRLGVVRKYLAEHGFIITDEYVIRENFYYVFLKVKRGKMALNEQEIETGIHLQHKKEGQKYLSHQLKYYQNLLLKVTGKRQEEIKKVIGHYVNALTFYF